MSRAPIPADGSAPVVFFANGPARLLMSCLIAEEIYPDRASRRLFLLDQYGYRYDSMLSVAREIFSSVSFVHQSTRRYSHLDQVLRVYLGRYPELRRAVTPGAEVVLFGLRSPVQKYLQRRARVVGATLRVWAEGMAIDRVFQPRDDEPWRGLLRRVLRRAFEYQHTYDTFYVFAREMYRDHPAYARLRDMPPLFTSRNAEKLAERIVDPADVTDLDELRTFDEVFFGQPLSEGDGPIDRDTETAMLGEILGDRKVLVLPHPGEEAALQADPPDRGGGVWKGKYDGLPGARVVRGDLPNDLLLLRLRPRRTSTWASTIGLTYAASHPESMNVFYPVDRVGLATLERYREHLPNIEIDDRFVHRRQEVGTR